MNSNFFDKVEADLAPERLDAYRQDLPGPAVTLARYLLNLALCESLYSPLQIAEVALRNAIHRHITVHLGSDRWYEQPGTRLTPWQVDQVADARKKLLGAGKPPTPGRMVAELNFGFWTGFFNKAHAQTGLGFHLVAHAFAQAPRAERTLHKLDARWKNIRDLRNRVFHHERIVHWTDLDAQHTALIEVIGWLSPELREMAEALDRFSAIRRAGLTPWLARIRHHWPVTPAAPATSASAGDATIAILDAPYDTEAQPGPFDGRRFGDETFRLDGHHLDALVAGKTLALDIRSEYVAFLRILTEHTDHA